jgi:hypothetical protein
VVHRHHSGLTLQVGDLKAHNKRFLQNKFCNIKSECGMLGHSNLFLEAEILPNFLYVKKYSETWIS